LGRERRRFPRVRAGGFVQVTPLLGGPPFIGRLHDVSIGGAYVVPSGGLADVQIETETEVRVVLKDRDHPDGIVVRAVLVRVEGPGGGIALDWRADVPAIPLVASFVRRAAAEAGEEGPLGHPIAYRPERDRWSAVAPIALWVGGAVAGALLVWLLG